MEPLLPLSQFHLRFNYFNAVPGYKFTLECVENPPTRQTRSNSTRPTGLGRFLRLGGLGWVTKFFFYSGSGWIWVIKLQTHQIRPDPPLFNIYLKYIMYLINFFF